MQKFKVNGERITDAGIIVTPLSETKSRIKVTITGVFFPVHQKSWGKYQVSKDSQTHLRNLLVGQVREFWKTGSRAGFEVSGKRYMPDAIFAGAMTS